MARGISARKFNTKMLVSLQCKRPAAIPSGKKTSSQLSGEESQAFFKEVLNVKGAWKSSSTGKAPGAVGSRDSYSGPDMTRLTQYLTNRVLEAYANTNIIN